MTYLENALKNGDAQLLGEGKAEKITYAAIDHTERYADPEEKVRAEYWAELIYRYGYDPKHIKVEVRVPDRIPNDIADLVIFHEYDQTRPYAVIEFKRDDITDSEFEQAVEQVCGNGTWAKFRASFVGVVAGQTRRFLDFSPRYGVLEREANIVADLPRRYGKPEEFRFRKGTQDDISPVNKEMLISTIKKCHQTLWGGGKLSPPEAFGELCKVIFVKISDEQASRKNGEPYQFQIKTHEPSDKLYERIQSIYEVQQQREPDVFTDTIKIDAATLRIIVSHIEGINLSKTDLDTKGVAFETFMDGFFKGHFGQYFTPREIIDFMVQMMQPQNHERVLDPACGSGGFLLHALDYVREEANDYHEDPIDRFKHWHDFAKAMLFGIEVNEEIARVAKMNMILHDDGHTNVISTDALQEFNRIRERTGNNEFKEGDFDLILTNPPFGARVLLSEHPYLEHYKLGNQTNRVGRKRPRKNQRTEILFLERIWEFLKADIGRAAVIIPDGILTNSSLQEVRDFLLEHFQINAIVSLPQTTFAHFGAAVKASIVFLRRRADDEKLNSNETIFMALPELIGYDATGRETANHLPEVVRQYQAFEKNSRPLPVEFFISEEKPQCFAVRHSKIKDRLDPHFYHPRFEKLLDTLRQGPHEILGNITEIWSQKWKQEEHPEEVFKYIEINSVSRGTGEVSFSEVLTKEAPSRAQMMVQKDDIIVSLTRPHHGSIALIDDDLDGCIVSTGFAVLRTIKDPTLSRLYLCSVLRSQLCLNQMLQRSSGGSYPAITTDQLMQILVPIPSPDHQKKIVEELSRHYVKVRQLRDEAEKEWEAAKAQFEAQLLSGEVS